jgi:hypothetical protein
MIRAAMTNDPASADASAKLQGVPLFERIRALRNAFGLSLADAKAVVDATDGRGPRFPEIGDAEELRAVLTRELGYCTCASEGAVALLRDLLRAARERSDAIGDPATFGRASRELESLMDTGPGWAEWVVFALEQRDFVRHGFRRSDLEITAKGRWLLEAMERIGGDDPAR